VTTSPVLLIHGFGSDPRGTWEQTGWTRALDRAGRRWVAPDLRGHGRAEKPHDPSAYTLASLAADLCASLDDDVFDVVGYSLGGELALELALTYPNRVRRVAAGGFGERRPLTVEEATALFDHVLHGAPAPSSQGAALWALASAAAGSDPRALAACLAGVASSPSFVGLESISGPVLLFAGADDSLASGLDQIASKLDAEFLQLPQRNHLTTLSSSQLRGHALAFLDASQPR
jgi:pimeloyl-ACP methyl ester carboxylesterase